MRGSLGSGRPLLLAASVGAGIPALQQHTLMASQRARSFFWSSKPSAASPAAAVAEPAAQAGAASETLAPATSAASDAAAAAATTVAEQSPFAFAQGTDIAQAVMDGQIKAITQLGDLHSLGLANSNPVGWCQSLLEVVHVYMGLPWWGTIVVATVVIRLLLLPFAIKAQRATAKLANLRPQSEPIQKEAMRLRSIGDTPGSTREYNKLLELWKQHNVSPFSAMWGLAQAPVFLSFFFAIKSMSQLPVPGFEVGGPSFFMDLTATDPTYILPVLSSIGVLMTMEARSQSQANTMRTVMRLLAIITIPFVATLPSGVFMYMIASSIVTLPQIYLLNVPAVRKLLGIPIINHDMPVAAGGSIAVRPITIEQASKNISKAQKELSRMQISNKKA
nr:Mitochondrial inner membrane protein oxa1l [Polyrhizophydium stewartii]